MMCFILLPMVSAAQCSAAQHSTVSTSTLTAKVKVKSKLDNGVCVLFVGGGANTLILK